MKSLLLIGRIKSGHSTRRRSGEKYWDLAAKVVSAEGARRAVKFFDPYEAPGPDGLYPVVLRKSLEAVLGTLVGLSKGCLAVGHTPEAWCKARVVSTPKKKKRDIRK